MRSSPSGLSGLAPLLPLRNNEVPIRASELQELLSWTLHEPDGLDGWEKEAVSDLTVYRLTETDEANPGRPVERGRCEVVLDAPIETVFALVDDPKQRATWDDIVGQSMQKYKSRGHSFVSFTLEGLMGLAAENFFLWDAQQAYDRDGIECEANALWSYVVLWQPAAISWEGLPPHEGCYKPAAFGIGIVRHGSAPDTKTRVVAMARVQFFNSMLQYFLPSIMRSVLSSQSQRLLQRISQINADVQESKSVQQLGIRGLQRISQSAIPVVPAQAAQTQSKGSADKDDAFLLDMPEELRQEIARKRESFDKKTVVVKAESKPDPSAKRRASDLERDIEAAVNQEAQGRRTSNEPNKMIDIDDVAPSGVISKVDGFMFSGATGDAVPASADDKAELEQSPQSRQNQSAVRRKLELPNGLQDAAAELGVSIGLGLGRVTSLADEKDKNETIHQDVSSRSTLPSGSEGGLRHRLASMQSKWLQDVSEVREEWNNFEDMYAKIKENELKKLRGTNSWLFHLIKESSAADFLPPPWRLNSGLVEGEDGEPAELAQELSSTRTL